jgi:aryl-alcohol dehydrogenase-like predicted oxidoreductase
LSSIERDVELKDMNNELGSASRRDILKCITATAAAVNLSPRVLMAASQDKITRKIPVSGEELSIIGVGSWQTFDISVNKIPDTETVQLMQAFFDLGGQLVDSSPMYGNSETVIGELITRVTNKDSYFAATKVWTRGEERGINQMTSSMQKMGVEVMDLMQIHNLRDWQTHLETLNEWKQQGKIRYTGITTSSGRDHDALSEILKTHDFDFVQFSYNLQNRKAERTLFPIIRDKGIATLINEPYQSGSLFRKVGNKPLPDWAAEFDCASWGQFFLKFIGSHPDVTCIIPATSKVKHMVDNMAAGFGRLPDADMRQRMIDYMDSI